MPRAAVIAHEVVKGVKLIRLCPRERGRWRASFCPSVRLWCVPVERGWVTASCFEELLIIETVFWDFYEENWF